VEFLDGGSEEKAKKNRGLDELYDRIWQQAKSYSWYMILAAIYIFFSLMVFGIELNIVIVLGVFLLVHIGSLGIIGVILIVNICIVQNRLSSLM